MPRRPQTPRKAKYAPTLTRTTDRFVVKIMKDGKTLLSQKEDVATLTHAAQQITLQKTMPLKSLEPGKYTVQIKVTDNVTKQSVSPAASFELR